MSSLLCTPAAAAVSEFIDSASLQQIAGGFAQIFTSESFQKRSAVANAQERIVNNL